jgi:hypothetical protein
MRKLAFLIYIAIGSLALADSIPKGYKLEEEFKSQTEDTIVRAYRGKPYDWTGSLEYRVFRKESPSVNGYLLWKGQNRASVLISSDGENIALNNHVMSDLGLLYVFTRQKDGTYKNSDIDFMDKVSQMFEESLSKKLDQAVDLDHSYCYANTWLSDHQLLGVFTGHESGRLTLSGYWFIYDCNTKDFSFDLTNVNQSAIHFSHNEKTK